MGTNAPAISIGPKQLLGGLGAVVLVASAFLNWADVTGPGGTAKLKGTGVGVEFLVDKGTDSDSPSILLLLAVAAVLIALGLFVASAHRFSTIAGGVLGLVVPVLYCVQVQRGLDDELSRLDISLTDFISVGVYVALAGGALALVAGLLPSTGREPAPPELPPPAPAA
jgi:hypothetical protein